MSTSDAAPSGNNNNDSGNNNDDESTSSSPPPPSNSSSPPPSDKNSPPPPSNNNSSSPPPPKNDGNSSPPPPKDNDNSSSPPPPKDNNNSSPSPPPPKDNNNSSPSPPPPKNDGNSSPPSKGSSKSPPSQSERNTPSLPPPPPSSSGNSKTRAISGPSEKGKDKEADSEDPFQGGMSPQQVGLIVGITAGVVVLLFFIMIILMCCCKKKKRRHEIHYYMDSGPKGNGSGYYNSGQQQNWQHWQNGPMDHVIKVPQSGGSSGPTSGGWLHPPPPPPMMPSGEMSSNYSGPRGPVLPPPSPNMAMGFGGQTSFTYEELATATNGFSQANLLGQGGFGYVHKGVFPNGKVVAVKSLKAGSGQGEREFQAEVEIISRVHHRHLVSLVGYCIAGGQRMLIYEFVSNNTLEYHLHGKGVPTMDWSKRMTIAMGSAKGLAYLHEDCHPRIIHRDIKTANILIDDNFEAMVADFGLAKLSDTTNTHVSTRVMGTFGYLAPEYASSGKLTEKSDVFSFGVMLLELITGRRPVDTTDQYMEDSLVDWARPILTRAMGDGNYEELVDPRLEDNYNPAEMARMVACAGASVRHSAKRRPKMSQIVRALEGAVSLDDLNEVRTGQGSQLSSNASSEYNTAQYNADMKKFRNIALNSQEYSSESGAQGDHTSTSSNSGASNSRI